MPRVVRAIAISGLIAIASSCGATPESTRKSNSSVKGNPSTTNGDVAKPSGSVSLAAAAFFSDTQDFTLSDIGAGLMPCGGSGSRTLADYNIKPWPADLKAFLAQQLATYPQISGLNTYFQGFYLSDTTLSDDIKENSSVHIDGLTCQNGAGGKMIVFFNYDVHVRQRQEFGELDRLHNMRGLTDRYTLEESPDALVATMFHELFHVVDFGKLANRETGAPSASRANIAEFSWDDPDTPIFDRISILYLDGQKEEFTRWYRNHSIHEPGITHFPLTASGPNATKDDFEYLENVTNFLSPYAMTNMYEDLASTLEFYYTGSRYGTWPTRKVYDRDVTNGFEGAEIIHRYDTKKIATSSTKHREKICAMTKLVLGEDCASYLD